MFEEVAGTVAEGTASPLAAVAVLAEPDDDALLALEQDEAQAVIELTQAAVAALHAVQALAIEAFTRREDEDLARLKDDARRAGRRGGITHIADDVVASMLAPSLHVAPRTAASFVGDARRLVNGLPRTFALLRAGRLEVGRARAIATESEVVARGLIDAFDEDLTTSDHPSPDGTGPRPRYRTPLVDLTTSGARKRAAATALRVDPESAERRAKDAVADRFVRVTPGLDPGVTTWSASQCSGESLKAWAAIEALATTYLGENSALGVGEARADALTDLILANATITTSIDLVVPAPAHAAGTATTAATVTSETGCACPCPIHDLASELGDLDPVMEFDDQSRDRPRASVAEVVYLDAVRRERCAIEETAFQHGESRREPELPGQPEQLGQTDPRVGVSHHQVGIILNEVVSDWLADPDTRIRLHEADPDTGQLLRHDPTVYRPGAALSRAVKTRDQHCRFPGCATDIRHCDLDHVIRFPDGPTRITNLHALCKKHHRFKHSAGWTVSMTPDGTCTWTTPLGRTHVTEPATLHDAAA